MNLRELKDRSNCENAQWFNMRSAAKGEPAEIRINGEIGRNLYDEGIGPEDFIREVKRLNLKDGEVLNIYINSPGGNVFDGTAIYNYLRSLNQKIIVTIDAFAASIASVIALAGDKILMPENTFFMIHNPWTFAIGDSRVMQKAASDLDAIREGAIKTYLSRSNLNRKELITMLDDATWIGADRAVEIGFADEILQPVRAAALLQYNLHKFYDKIPDAIELILHQQREENRNRREQLEKMKSA